MNDKLIGKYYNPEDESGFAEVLFARQAKMTALRKRLKKYYLTETEINNLFKIIEDAELEMEKIKRKFNSKKYTEEDLIKFQNKLVDIQNEMKNKFDNKLSETLKKKYNEAKKKLDQMNNGNK